MSPHPWLFWASVGAPLLVRAWREAPAHGVGFVGAFYALLIGSKVAVAALAALGHRVLRGGGLRVVHGVAGVLLVGAGATTLLAIGLRPLLT